MLYSDRFKNDMRLLDKIEKLERFLKKIFSKFLKLFKIENFESSSIFDKGQIQIATIGYTVFLV